ncbi:glyoxalase superfamily protein [Asticcacaulis sp. AC402]|uniref:glyoxalase superfamily protein n=1 Tax=Asticcacaulis sp. AC402 TaxID=1282361 RepID=UPI0003C3E268|nr:glyoxalase superfamily protein [Asticcacaulis sp. AC402]ESQ76651.1 hypothetical protein ABAC402_02955 [Asticcacaulis sp. AC402]
MRTLSISPVFHVSDLDQALKFYRDGLGFDEEFRFDTYVGLRLGEIGLHLAENRDNGRPLGGGTVYVVCDAVDAYYAQITAKGIIAIQPPMDQLYRMRDFILRDTDGNQISFGHDLGE